MSALLQGTILLTAFIAGVVALFAPCCISVMLPAYFASSFRRRDALVAMTFVYAAGVATVIVPIALGATLVSRLIFGYHEPVFLIAGGIMVLLGLATLTGWRPPLPMVGMRGSGGSGAGTVYMLGVFAGIGSACCAPVLAGVVVLSGAAGSFVVALAVGATYVLGMVLPLFIIALLWDRFDWGSSWLFRPRRLRWHVAGREVTATPATLLGGVVLTVIGLLIMQLAITGPAMSPTGWQASVSATLGHWSSRLTTALAPIPGWVVALALIGLVTAFAVMARRRSGDEPADDASAPHCHPQEGKGAPV